VNVRMPIGILNAAWCKFEERSRWKLINVHSSWGWGLINEAAYLMIGADANQLVLKRMQNTIEPLIKKQCKYMLTHNDATVLPVVGVTRLSRNHCTALDDTTILIIRLVFP
jgi:hypothetical protein